MNKQNKFATLITALLVMLMAGSAMCATTYDSSVTLENKDGSWNVIVDDYSAIIDYNSVGEEFVWHATGTVKQANIEYSLIYYADKPDRFNYWGGDNPGALIDTIMTDAYGDFESMGSVELGMDLPMTPDANMNASEYNYTESDGYENANGAKLWMVPSADYDAANKKVNKWNPTQWLFETDLITYEDCGEYVGAPPTATFTIGCAFNVDTVSIMILNATDAGSVDMTLTYDPAVVTVTGVDVGDMDAEFWNIGTDQVRIGAYQTNSPGINGDFVLAEVSFGPVGTEPYDFDITVTTYKDATPCGNSMPYDVTTCAYCPYDNGDVNGDGLVDMFDAMYLAKHTIEISGFENIVECAADVDGTAPIDIADASYLAKHILGITGYETLN